MTSRRQQWLSFLALLGVCACLLTAGCGVPPDPLLDPTATAYPDLRGDYVTVNGVRLHYVQKGQGEPLVLLHGFGGWVFSFRHVLEPLSARYRVIAIDLMGFGLSDKPARADYSITNEARLVLAALDSLGVERATILGHSYGGGVAAAAALLAPKRVRGVIFVNSITLKFGKLTIADGLLRAFLKVRPLTSAALVVAAPRDQDFRRILREGYARPQLVSDDVVQGYLYPYHLPDARGALPAVGLTGGAGRGSPRVYPQKLRLPVYVMWGEYDKWITVGRGYQLAARIPGALFAPVRNAGHFPLEEQPERSVQLIHAFMDNLAAREAAAAATAPAAPAR